MSWGSEPAAFKAPAGATYKLLAPEVSPPMIGAMFWTIDADRHDNYNYSNTVNPHLHAYPAASSDRMGEVGHLRARFHEGPQLCQR